jgi:hypothetical protein
MATKTTRENINGDTTYKWTASGSGTNEYYLEAFAGGTPGITLPTRLYESGTLLSTAALGSLTAGTWNWGDNDGLGYSTVYVRLTTGGPDPDDVSYQTLVTQTDATLTSNVELNDNTLLLPDLALTASSVATSDFSVNPLAANGNRKMVQLTNDHATESIFYAWQTTQPANTNVMRELKAGETVWFSALDGIPTCALWAYQTSGGAIDLKVAEVEKA